MGGRDLGVSRQDNQSDKMDMNFNAFQEPRGVMRILHLVSVLDV